MCKISFKLKFQILSLNFTTVISAHLWLLANRLRGQFVCGECNFVIVAAVRSSSHPFPDGSLVRFILFLLVRRCVSDPWCPRGTCQHQGVHRVRVCVPSVYRITFSGGGAQCLNCKCPIFSSGGGGGAATADCLYLFLCRR